MFLEARQLRAMVFSLIVCMVMSGFFIYNITQSFGLALFFGGFIIGFPIGSFIGLFFAWVEGEAYWTNQSLALGKLCKSVTKNNDQTLAPGMTTKPNQI